MNAPSLQRRIRNGTLLMLALVVLLGLYTLPRVYRLGGAIRRRSISNYVSIEAAQNMHAALNTLQMAEHDGKAKDVLPSARQNFLQWLDVENHDFTEMGEPELAADIGKRANKLFADIAGVTAGRPPRSRIRRIAWQARRSDRDEQSRDVPRGQPLGTAGQASRV